ncbi:MAG: class IV adenylate cyclase [Acidobacteria bacterium]|nr:class IV adenylate cyclase [Acidobacteriota bacterium]
MQEIEVKLPVKSPATMRRRLRQLGFRLLVHRLFERNLVLDTPQGAMRQSLQLLRLRSKGGRWWITWKGRPETGRRHKVRAEIDLQIPHGEQIREILHYLGYRAAFEYQKYRTEFRRASEKGKAVLDETPIGNYLELEGPAAWIDRTARELGYDPSDYILASYSSLYLDWCIRHGRSPGNMVFKGKSA